MKLLIVVSKLLTGFDAPSCTYIYLDNELRDHNLFQAICRTNRLDGDDKDYGHIVDFKELFGDVQEAIAVYSSDELDIDEGSGGDNNVHLKDWLEEGKKKLDEAREALRYLCEPVPLPREVEQFLHYFCGDAANPNALNETEPLRISFYKAVAVFVRAFAAIAQDLTEAGYSDAEAAALQKEVEFYSEIRAAIKKHSGEELDIKPYEADMRHLLNTYVQADPAADLGELGEMSLTELIIETGIHDAIARKLNEKGKLSRNAIAEGIINNVRKTIIRDQLTDPRFYEQMSKLLDDLIKQSRADAAAYEEFLRKAEALVKRLARSSPTAGVPAVLHGKPEATVIFNNLPRILAATTLPVPRAEPTTEKRGSWLWRSTGRCASRRRRAGRATRPARAQVLNALFPHPRRGTARRRWRSSRSSRTSRGTDGRDDPARRHRHRGDAQGHQACPPLRASAERSRDAGRAQRDTRLEVARAYAISKLGWIREQQAKLRGQARETPRQFVERESHYLWGRRYLLSVSEAGRQALRHARSPPHHAHRAPRQQQGEARGGHARVAQVPAARRRARTDPEVGAEAGRQGGRLLPPAHEDQVGRLQPPGADTSA